LTGKADVYLGTYPGGAMLSGNPANNAIDIVMKANTDGSDRLPIAFRNSGIVFQRTQDNGASWSQIWSSGAKATYAPTKINTSSVNCVIIRAGQSCDFSFTATTDKQYAANTFYDIAVFQTNFTPVIREFDGIDSNQRQFTAIAYENSGFCFLKILYPAGMPANTPFRFELHWITDRAWL
jgi:hypothetical protein